MAKVSIIQREYKRQRLLNKNLKKRIYLKNIIMSSSNDREVIQANIKLQKLPKNSSKPRLRRRCYITGRGRGVYKKFGICRHYLRYHAMIGNIPGLRKSSW